jgi:16S rRNA processing protein RimM
VPARHRRLGKRARSGRAQRAAGERSVRSRDSARKDSEPAGATPRAQHSAPPLVCIGRVVGAHGLAGELRVRLAGAAPESFESAPSLWLARDESGAGAVEHALRGVAAGRADECRVRLEGVGDRGAAESARGRFLLARADDLARAAADEYYVYELVGCAVEDRSGRALGAVRGVTGHAAADLLIVADADGREHLVPLARALLCEVDVAARRIVIDPPAGLFGERA